MSFPFKSICVSPWRLISAVYNFHFVFNYFIYYSLKVDVRFILKSFFFFAYGYSVAPTPFIGKTFSHWIVFAPFSKISWSYLCGSNSGFSILFYWPVCYLSDNTIESWLLYLCKRSWYWVDGFIVFYFYFSKKRF